MMGWTNVITCILLFLWALPLPTLSIGAYRCLRCVYDPAWAPQATRPSPLPGSLAGSMEYRNYAGCDNATNMQELCSAPQCFSGRIPVTAADHTGVTRTRDVTIRGCAHVNFCTSVSRVLTYDVKCCTGELCNSAEAKSPTFSLFLTVLMVGLLDYVGT